ncbi:MAG: hypothetical protein ACFE0Q_11560 [Anaerolineae bacterium]
MTPQDVSADKQRWAKIEQGFMRFIGVSLMIIALVSMVFGAFESRLNLQVVQGINIATTLILGAGSLWSLWWSANIERIHGLIMGFQARGNTPTYLAAVMQFLVGGLFSLELESGNWTLGLIGVVMIISGVFFLWRAQQIVQVR